MPSSLSVVFLNYTIIIITIIFIIFQNYTASVITYHFCLHHYVLLHYYHYHYINIVIWIITCHLDSLGVPADFIQITENWKVMTKSQNSRNILPGRWTELWRDFLPGRWRELWTELLRDILPGRWSELWTVCFVCWLLIVPATCECISGTDLHRQFDVLPHWDRSCRSNFPSHPVTVYRPVPVLTLKRQAPGRVATGVPIFKSLVWLDPEKIQALAGFEPGTSRSRGGRLNH